MNSKITKTEFMFFAEHLKDLWQPNFRTNSSKSSDFSSDVARSDFVPIKNRGIRGSMNSTHSERENREERSVRSKHKRAMSAPWQKSRNTPICLKCSCPPRSQICNFVTPLSEFGISFEWNSTAIVCLDLVKK